MYCPLLLYFTTEKKTLHVWSFYQILTSNPIEKLEIEEKPSLRDEKYYPNGTVVGKYTYNDKEGNPIHVKYFADDSSYGVELKSIKIIDSSSIQPPSLSKINYVTKATDSPAFHPFKIVPGLLNEKYYTEKSEHKGSDQSKYLKDVARVNNLNVKVNPDYDIYYKNELKVPKKFDKDKIGIYLQKHKRKIRNVLNEYTVPKFCELI
ncbi:hypothetical protein K1T71_004367 [Dendrolimus kikuchii]|uniref:Uncharacterized protein n=1 Tax=Dendrolimus kikuchii TaxID=765133 RepID=A0ACC1D7Y6_9NEOP|nr:hypothetical protein K1T71_004367 [Dendrolimus kikuchii]